MGGGPKQFGIDAERVPAVLARVGQPGLDFQGFHISSGSQYLRAEYAPAPVRTLNIGGGFGVPYLPDEQLLDVAALGVNLAQLSPSLNQRLPQARVFIELGRYLVDGAGVHVNGVVDRKISRGRVFLGVGRGLRHRLPASGKFGQVIRKNYPVAMANRVLGGKPDLTSAPDFTYTHMADEPNRRAAFPKQRACVARRGHS